MKGELGQTITDIRLPSEAGPLVLVSIVDGVASTHPLPDSGSVVIGRASDCEVRIEHASISRNHARISVLAGIVSIEDLGSSNGTWVREAQLAPKRATEITLGEVIDVGSVTLMLQRHRHTPTSRRIWSHGYFEARLEDECARAQREHKPLSLLRVRALEVPPPGAIAAALAEALPEGAVLGAYGPGEFEVIAFGLDAVGGSELGERIHKVAARHEASVRIGKATFPTDGKSPYALLAVANHAVLDERVSRDPDLPTVIDPAMKRLYTMVEKIAVGTIGVLLLGETGAGKEVLARQIHRLSPRANGPFVPLNCAALPENLLESELFGHEKGAFTGANNTRVGLVETADGGTLFLDEVGEMPMSLQAKLLRMIEERAVMRVGGRRPIALDLRLIAATNRDLETEVTAGNFRQDLLYRLEGVRLTIPPLRERRAEIEPLARTFAAAAAADMGLPQPPELSDAAIERLLTYSWPGNVRELRNVIERAVLLCDERIEVDDLPTDKMSTTTSPPSEPPVADPPMSEKQRIIEALAACGGNQTRAAERLGISRRTLTNRLDKYNIPRPLKGRR